jgi:iron-sulfur cluster insertion protein
VNTLLHIGQDACEKIATILVETPHKPHFRLQIKGGGCSGFEYIFGIDDTIREQDFHQSVPHQENPFIMLVDAVSYQYVQNSQIDYIVDAKGERFVVTNPNAETSCSCGSSFALKQPAGKQ